MGIWKSFWPPASSTLPEGSVVSVKNSRAWGMSGAVDQEPPTFIGVKISTEAVSWPVPWS